MSPSNRKQIVELLITASQALALCIAIALKDDGKTKRIRNHIEKLITQIEHLQERI